MQTIIVKKQIMKKVYLVLGEIIISMIAFYFLFKTGSKQIIAWAFPGILSVAAFIQSFQFLDYVLFREYIEISDEAIYICSKFPKLKEKILFSDLKWTYSGPRIEGRESLTGPIDQLNYGLIIGSKYNNSTVINLNEENYDIPFIIQILKERNVPVPVCFIQIDRQMKTIEVIDVYKTSFIIGNNKKDKPDYLYMNSLIEENFCIEIEILPQGFSIKNICKNSQVKLPGGWKAKDLEYLKSEISLDGILYIGKVCMKVINFDSLC